MRKWLILMQKVTTIIRAGWLPIRLGIWLEKQSGGLSILFDYHYTLITPTVKIPSLFAIVIPLDGLSNRDRLKMPVSCYLCQIYSNFPYGNFSQAFSERIPWPKTWDTRQPSSNTSERIVLTKNEDLNYEGITDTNRLSYIIFLDHC